MKNLFYFLEVGNLPKTLGCGVGKCNFCNQVFFRTLNICLSLFYNNIKNVTFA